jgi:AcrR family transcriptional regulator
MATRYWPPKRPLSWACPWKFTEPSSGGIDQAMVMGANASVKPDGDEPGRLIVTGTVAPVSTVTDGAMVRETVCGAPIISKKTVAGVPEFTETTSVPTVSMPSTLNKPASSPVRLAVAVPVTRSIAPAGRLPAEQLPGLVAGHRDVHGDEREALEVVAGLLGRDARGREAGLVARWEPNTRERLVRAAVELFAEQGYDATTVSQIAERAGGLTKMTFFRHFPDKREVLFAAGQEAHGRLLADAIAAAPAQATPLQAVAAGLDAVTATFTEERREFSARLREVIAGHRELQERAWSKRAALAGAMTDALGKRGVPDPVAGLAAEIGVRAFYDAFGRWADPAGDQTLTDLTRQALGELRAALAALA